MKPEPSSLTSANSVIDDRSFIASVCPKMSSGFFFFNMSNASEISMSRADKTGEKGTLSPLKPCDAVYVRH